MSRDKKLITGRIVGGLGNQLFIWAATNYYAIKLSKTPVFDIHDEDKFMMEQILTGEIKTIHLSKFKRKIIEVIIRISRISVTLRKLANSIFGIYQQDKIGFSENWEPDRKSEYLVGYFQSSRYIQGVGRSKIEHEFDLSLSTEGVLKANQEFQKDGGVAIHIRLGDYLNAENHYFGILAPAYYMNALKSLGVCPGSTVWIFSDSPIMAKSIYSSALGVEFNLIWASESFVLTTIEEFKLLTNANKLAIANSTFSWWAALLAGEKCQTICPSKWFKASADPEALMPEKWATVESIWLQRKI